MKLLKRFFKSKTNFLFFLLIVLAVIPRFIFLNNVPNAINQDELHYVLDAKSFFLTGKDVLGQVTPLDVLLFHSPESEPMQAELQYFLEIPVFGLLNFSLANLVFPNAVLGVLTVLLIYLVTLRLFNKNIALLAGLLAAINPWLIFLSRTTYEAGPATLFFLCTFYILLITKGWKILLTIPFALLAFYSYIGTKLIFLPFMFLSILYAYLYVNKRKYLKQYSLVFIFSIFLTLFFFFQFKHYEVSRTSEIVLPNSPEIVEQVIGFRKMAIQSPFLNLFDNKFSIYSSVLTKNIVNVFSPSYLFVNADYFFMMGGHGLFYQIDAIFLIAGLASLFLSNKKLFLIFGAVILTGALPQVLYDPNGNGNFTPHIALVIPFFIILIGVGINKTLDTFKNKKYSYLLIIFLVFIYLLSFISFSYFYFLKFPLQEGTFEIQNRILSKYISLYKNNIPITIFSENPKLTYREFLFYTNAYNKNTVDKINKSLQENKFVFNNISFFSCNNTSLKDTTTLIISDVYCAKTFNAKSISIAQLKDSGRRYDIFNDKICSHYNLPNYVNNLKLSDLNIESLSEKKFCETFMVSYR